MPSAEIITIGSEILLGELVDTNSATIAKSLRAAGINLFRLSTIGDNVGRIAQAISEALNRADIVITTGGLGPTVDDPTREAVAKTFGINLEFQESLWQHIDQRIRNFGRIPGENQKKQAYVPQGANIIHNPVGTAPAFIVERQDKCLISLPGVPSEMEYLLKMEVLPYLLKKYSINEVIRVRIVKTFNIGEGMLDEKIADLEHLSNPTVGLSAHFGMCDIRITAKAHSLDEADQMLAKIEAELSGRIGGYIYGVDQETIIDAILGGIIQKNREFGLFMPKVKGISKVISKLPDLIKEDDEGLSAFSFLTESDEIGQRMKITTIKPGNVITKEKIFAGNSEYFIDWYTNQSYCDLLSFVQGLDREEM